MSAGALRRYSDHLDITQRPILGVASAPRRAGASAASVPAQATRAQRQDDARVIVDRARHLPEAERELLMMIFGQGVSVAELVRQREADPAQRYARARTLRKRVHALVTRVLDPRFAYVAQHAGAWPARQRDTARACILRGLSMRKAARELNLSLHSVRRYIDAVRIGSEEHRRTALLLVRTTTARTARSHATASRHETASE